MVYDNVGVYHDPVNEWQVSRYHFMTLEDHSIFFCHDYDSVDQFVNSQHKIKFAAYHVPFPQDESWLQRFGQVYPHADHSFIFCSELHQATLDQMRQLDLDRVSIFVAGTVNSMPFAHAELFPWVQHLETTSDFYKNRQPQFLEQRLTHHTNRSRYFDILLGCQRTHRDYIYNYVQSNQLNDQVIMTYHRTWNQDLRLNTEFVMESEGIEFMASPKHTIQQVRYYDHVMCLSQIIPLDIYNQTYYTLVAETNAENEFNFYTEKIWKPIIAGRLFIVIAGQYFLKNLRALGFQTYDGIIDESYDQVSDPTARWQMALDQMRWLCQQDPVLVLEKIKPIAKYNQQLVQTTDWHGLPRTALAGVVKRYLESVEQMQN